MSGLLLADFNTTVVTPPTVEPVTLQEAKKHIRQPLAVDDAEIPNTIKAARDFAELKSGATFTTTVRKLWLPRFPTARTDSGGGLGGLGEFHDRRIVLPHSPLIGVSAVEHLDTDGVLQTLTVATDYVVTQGSRPGYVVPAFGKHWPTTRQTIEAVRVTYSAGYGAASDVPMAARQAILMLVAGFYRDREPTDFEQLYRNDPSIEALLMTVSDGFKWV